MSTDTNEMLLSIQNHVTTIQEEQALIKLSLDEYKLDFRSTTKKLHGNILRIASQPAKKIKILQATADDGDDRSSELPPLPFTLSKNPEDLYILWKEYVEGIGGRKPARLFTLTKRGRVKSLYHRRKVVWDSISLQINAGMTAHVAIDRIYQAYGANQSVTLIINSMLRDRKERGSHPNLQF